MKSRQDRGMVTAELMTIAPLGVAFVFLLLWIVSLGLTHVRVTDAARESARLLARGESMETARSAARQHAPDGARVKVKDDDGTIVVTVTAKSRLPVPFFSRIGSRTVKATSVAARELP